MRLKSRKQNVKIDANHLHLSFSLEVSRIVNHVTHTPNTVSEASNFPLQQRETWKNFHQCAHTCYQRVVHYTYLSISQSISFYVHLKFYLFIALLSVPETL